MTRQHAMLALWGSAAVLLAYTSVRVARQLRAFDREASSATRPPTLLDPRTLRSGDSVRQRSRAIIASDVFRLTRSPSVLPYGSSPQLASAAPQPPRPSRPHLTVNGILGGPPWEALLDGVPGNQTAVLVREGDTLGYLRIRRVMRDSVIVSDADTTWRLPLKRAWQ